MANTFPINFYTEASGQLLNGTTGALINMLDRYLVNGGDPIPISNISVSNNIATATLTYPYTLDPYFNTVWLLLHGEGTNNGTTFTDSSLNVRNPTNTNGGSITSTSQYRFGSSSCYFPNTTNTHLWYNTNINIGLLDFTIEAWIKVVNKVNSNIFSDANTISLNTTSSGYASFTNTTASGNYGFTITSTTDISTGGINGWHHVAISRYSNTFTLFIDGVPEVSFTPPSANNTVGSSVYIGGYGGNTGCGSYLDEVRLTRGYARYKTNFSSTLPAGPFPNSRSDSVELNQIVTVSGGTGDNTVFNDNFRVRSVATDLQTITFPITTNVNPGAVSNMTVKQKPLGWDKPYSDTNLAVYRSSDVTGTRLYLRVDDTNALYSALTMYETMSSISTGTPTNTATIYWAKSSTATISTINNWIIIGDSKTFYFLSIWQNYPPVYVFGDITSYKAGDAFNCILVGHSVATTNDSTANTISTNLNSNTSTTGSIIARNVRQVWGYIGFFKSSGTFNTSFGYTAASGAASFIPYPNPCDNGIHLTKVYVIEYDGSTAASRVMRGHYKGLLVPIESVNGSIARKTFLTIDNILYMAHPVVSQSGATYAGEVFFNLIGPWS